MEGGRGEMEGKGKEGGRDSLEGTELLRKETSMTVGIDRRPKSEVVYVAKIGALGQQEGISLMLPVHTKGLFHFSWREQPPS